MPRRPKPTQEGIVAELFAILQEIASDGVISDDEATQLHEWLLHNRHAGIPKFDFLRQLLDQFLADGKITVPERKAIHSAVEKVLPPELRQEAKLARQAVALKAKAEAANKKEAERAKRPIYIGDFMVMGIRYDGRESLVRNYVRQGHNMHLVREPSNAFDPNAILIRTFAGDDIGYMPREDAAIAAPLIDAGALHQAYCKKILEGRNYPTPVIYAQLFRGDQQIPQAYAQKDVPTKSQRTQQIAGTAKAGCGCGGCATIAACITVFVVMMALLR